MSKTNTKSEAQKKINNKAVAKYRNKIKDDEIFCEACLCPVKKLSLFQHNRGKKHIEKSKNVSKDIEDIISKALDKIKTGVNIKETVRELFYYIKNDYFDADECEILDEDEKYKETDAKTEEEKEFCNQKYSGMVMDLDKMIDNVSDANLYDSLKLLSDEVDADNLNAKQKLLKIWRRIKNPETPKEVKTIQASKPILKKIEPIQYLNEEFPEYDKFIKATNKAKYNCLEYIVYNLQQIFEEDDYKKLTNALEEDEDEIEYDYIYEQVLKSKKEYELEERRQKSRINYFDNSDEEEEQEEEEEEY